MVEKLLCLVFFSSARLRFNDECWIVDEEEDVDGFGVYVTDGERALAPPCPVPPPPPPGPGAGGLDFLSDFVSSDLKTVFN